METITLNGSWDLRGKQQNREGKELCLTARVPGCVQLDLSREGYLPEDLFFGENIRQTERFEDYEWILERTFRWEGETARCYLVFEGVDCLAEYTLNGVSLGESENSFIAHEFSVDGVLLQGENHLKVRLRSPVVEALGKDYSVKLLTGGVNPEARHLRKPPHSYGWDIFPRAVTSGLWREVRLERRDPLWFSQLFFVYEAKKERVTCYYELKGDWRWGEEVELSFNGSCGGESPFSWQKRVNRPMGCLSFPMPEPKLWWPYGYGEPKVYDGVAAILRDGTAIHQEKISFGLRTVELERRDALGEDAGQFRILINGVEILCKGSNWVPLDAFHSRDAERLERALGLVKDVGCNILRCWGGNVYEDHAFFDFCDRNGIMVWQDFSMACAFYPEDDAFKANLEREATAVIRKLRNHPSLILWAGDNEVDASTSRYDPNCNSLTRELLKKCVELNDYSRPYLPSSPYISPEAYGAGQRSQAYGSPLVEDHLWGPRDYYKSEYYRNNRAHFVSETGYHGCPSPSSIRKFISPHKVWPYHNNSEWILHSSDQKGNDHRVMLMEKQVRRLFGEVPTELEDYALASQISQAEAKKFFIERIRVGRPEKTGIIWWNLLDGWPQMSDAVVDYFFEKKLAYHYIKRSQAPFAVVADEISPQALRFVACNDTLKEKRGSLRVKDSQTGEQLWEGDFAVGKNQSSEIVRIPFPGGTHRLLILEWDCGGERGKNHYLLGEPPVSFSWLRERLKEVFNQDADSWL